MKKIEHRKGRIAKCQLIVLRWMSHRCLDSLWKIFLILKWCNGGQIKIIHIWWKSRIRWFIFRRLLLTSWNLPKLVSIRWKILEFLSNWNFIYKILRNCKFCIWWRLIWDRMDGNVYLKEFHIRLHWKDFLFRIQIWLKKIISKYFLMVWKNHKA